MEPGGSIPHLQGLHNNPYPELSQVKSRIDLRSILILSSNLPLVLLKDLLDVRLTNYVVYETRRFNAAFTRVLQLLS